jgi:hypothetical protein
MIITLTDSNFGNLLFVRSEHVSAVTISSQTTYREGKVPDGVFRTTLIYTIGGNCLTVRESPEQVLEMCAAKMAANSPNCQVCGHERSAHAPKKAFCLVDNCQCSKFRLAESTFETCAECPKIQTCNEVEICLNNTRPADPAQSAPSAPTGQDWNDACDFIKKNADPEAIHLPYLEIANLVVTYAALRTAQLERELADALKPHTDLWTKYEAEVDKWSHRAETAEKRVKELEEIINRDK